MANTKQLLDETLAKAGIWIVSRSSRNKSLGDKICRVLAIQILKKKPEHDFMQDDLIDQDEGYDPEELERYQRGEDSR